METDADITLDIYRPEDVEPMYNILKEEEFYNNLLHLPRNYTRQNAADWVEMCLKMQADGDSVTKKVIRYKGEFIGGIGNTGISEKEVENHRTEIGYYIGKPYWNRGFATQALKQYTQLLFNEWPIVKIIATVYTYNIGSAKALQKAGFEKEATFLKHFNREGKYIDCDVFSIFK